MKYLLCAATAAFLCQPASASSLCVKDRTPFALASDTMTWSMTIAPSQDCIQGLRWSYMQIYDVSVVQAPSKGRLVVVGSGFRYFAGGSDDQNSVDKFTLLISGKNRHEVGSSTLEVEVHPTAMTSGHAATDRSAAAATAAELSPAGS
ncbi:hypothetical protein ABIC03_003458 [Bradyrhizobium sp. RT6a]|uniref:hypothetical protein n=1 Tax=Bradyrhizobium sp. RT6a TaxID=3156381 RepID=UPI003395182E